MGFASMLKGLEAGGAALGRRVYRRGVATDLGAFDVDTPTVNLFQIWGGNVLLTHIYGIVLGAAIGAGATEIELWYTPTRGAGAGTPVGLCTDSAAINGAAINTIFTIDGTGGGMVTCAHIGVAVSSFCTNKFFLMPGIIALGVEVAVNTGRIDWILHYVPLSGWVDTTAGVSLGVRHEAVVVAL